MPSEYPSFRYKNNRYMRGKIPPHDMALVRLLMKFDGQFMRNGVKLLATSHYRQHNHTCTPEDIHWAKGYSAKVGTLTLNDYRNAMKYYFYTGWTPNHLTES